VQVDGRVDDEGVIVPLVPLQVAEPDEALTAPMTGDDRTPGTHEVGMPSAVVSNLLVVEPASC
jgi:hypothetical protein